MLIDAGIEDREALVSGIPADALMLSVEPGEDGLSVLAGALEGRSGVKAIHVLSHGRPGAIRLGGRRLDAQSLQQRGATLAKIGSALAPGADILLAGCDVASLPDGRRFLQLLARGTGADVAASDDPTGGPAVGANWNLEVHIGDIETRLALNGEARRGYQGHLAVGSQLTYSFANFDGSEYGTKAPFNQEVQSDNTAYQLYFGNWLFDDFDNTDIAVNPNASGLIPTISDSSGDSFQFVEFTTEVFCGMPISFDVVGFENGAQVAGPQSFTLSSQSPPVRRGIGFASVDEIQFQNVSVSGGSDGSCVSIDDIVVNQAVSSNTQPAYSNLDATIAFDEASGSPVVIDGDARISDAELDAANDYAGSSLTVERTGGATTDDDFGFDTGAGTFGVAGSDLVSGGSVFASFTESGGTLTISFNSSATTASPALVDDVLQGVTYANFADPEVVEYDLTLTFDDGDPGGALQISESRPVVFDPALAPIASSTTLDFTALEPELADDEALGARIIQELLFSGFDFEDATESGQVTSSDLQLEGATSDPATTPNRFESDATFLLDSIDIENFNSSAQNVSVHGYRNGNLQVTHTLSLAGNAAPQTFDMDALDAGFQAVDEVRFTVSSSDAVAIDNIIVDAGNQRPTLDLDTGSGGDGAMATFRENTDQGTGAADGVAVTGTVDVADADGTIDSVTVTLDNNQADPGEQLYLDGTDLVGAVGVAGSGNRLTLSRNGASENALEDTLANVRYQNNSDTPDTTVRTVTVEATDNLGATGTATATLTIEAGNDAPSITGPGGTLQPDEDVTFDLSGANEIQIADPDAGGATVEVVLAANNGSLTLGSTTGIAFDSGSNGASVMTVSGTVADLNNALATLDYQGNADYFGIDSVSATVNDRGNTGTDPGNTGDGVSEADSLTVSLDVQSVPDAPTISTINDQTMDEEATLSGIAFTIGDAETAADMLSVTLTVGTPSLVTDSSTRGSDANRTLQFTAADEVGASTTVTVTVDDGSQSTTESFQLTVNAVDEAPTFSATGPFSVGEAAPDGTAVGDVDADDGDGGATDANVTYAIVGGNTGGAFAIDGGTGAITLADATAVDFDTRPAFSLDVEANDGTNAPTVTVIVNVSNAAPSTPVDSDPVMGGSGEDGLVSEDAPNGTAAGITGDAGDPGGGNVSYALVDDAGGRFQINAGTGVVTIADTALIDFEAAASHSITVRATDDDGADSGTASFMIEVTDVDSPPTFTANGPFTVGEAPSNGVAVGDVDATDGDTGAADAGINYSITGGNAGGAFVIDNSGAITVADGSQIDFETSGSFNLTVQADDGGSTVSATVTVNVTDQPPARPVDTDAGADSVAEDPGNGTPVGVDVTSNDPAGGAVTYALTNDAGGRFAIDGAGVVTIADTSLIDFESNASHTIDIEARDADGTASATLSVTLAVTDAPDDPTVMAPPNLTGANALDATGLYTEVDLERDGDATATDDEDGTLTPEPQGMDNPAWLRPGTHTITWAATDSAGASATEEQIVEVRPRAAFGVDRTVQEGTSVSLVVELNGDAIDSTTPSIDFDVAGSSTVQVLDYAGLAAPGTVAIVFGDTASIGFDVLADGVPEANPETLVLETTGASNASLARRTRASMTITEENQPPLVTLSAAQSGGADPVVVVDQAGGNVTVTAATNDATPAGSMTYNWTANGLTDTDGAANDANFVFTPTGLSAGLYALSVEAVDNGTPVATGSARIAFRVVGTLPTLGGSDTDGDGLADNDAGEGLADRDGDLIPDYRDPYRDANTVHQTLTDSAGYRLEAQPGLNLAQGAVAFAVDADGVLVTGDQIESVTGWRDSLTNVGGRFDFTLYGLPNPGGSARVVLPQRAAIPEKPLYRLTGVLGNWQNFTADAVNVLASAPGAPGYCPPPDDPSFTAGLTPGDLCVRLTLEDGGMNDADGQANGRIRSTGGVALENQTPARVEVESSGGALAWHLFWLMLLAAGRSHSGRGRGVAL